MLTGAKCGFVEKVEGDTIVVAENLVYVLDFAKYIVDAVDEGGVEVAQLQHVFFAQMREGGEILNMHLVL